MSAEAGRGRDGFLVGRGGLEGFRTAETWATRSLGRNGGERSYTTEKKNRESQKRGICGFQTQQVADSP